jgi:hypothetical protein
MIMNKIFIIKTENMKRIQLVLFITGLLSSILAIGQDVDLNSSSAQVLSWDNKSIDLGTIHQNQPVEVVYRFTNTGSQPIIITDVKTSCGCTAAKHADEPVKPGESSEITVTYNAKAIGTFNKTITVTTTAAAEPNVLQLSGEVK